MIQNGFTKEFILVLLDYCIAISNVGDPNLTLGLDFPLTPELLNCVEECINENKQIIVRMVPAMNEIRPTEVAKIVLQKIIDVFISQTEVIILTSNQQQQHTKDENWENTSKIMLVIEQFRMGDTIPKTCICFDLRARYLFSDQDFTSLIQDVGKVFGYSKRPLLLLSQQANICLSDIWDSDTGYISWESLKTKLKSTHLGKNLIRRSQPTTVQTINTISVPPENDEDQEQSTIEVDTTEKVIQQFKEIYENDPKETAFLFRLKITGDCSAFKHRIFLKAEPQIGKTGAFLHLAFLLEEKLCNDSSVLKEFTHSVDDKKSLDEIGEDLKMQKENLLGVLKRARA
jgi:hypothetical protein